MSTLTVQQQQQQQPVIKNTILQKLPQNHLPLVHVLTSRIDNDDEKKHEPFQFEKIIKFLLDPHSTHLIDRRVGLCHKLYRYHNNGYLLKDLHYLMKIFNILAELCQKQALYIDPFIELLKNCSKRFLLDKSTDAEIYSSKYMTELDMEGFKLIAADSGATDTILRATEERVLAAAATQNYVLEQYHKQDLQLEKAFYINLIKSHVFQEKRLDQWKSFIARTSKYPLLIAAKDSQNQAIQQSRPEEKDYSGYHTVHNLEIPNLSITAFTGPFLQIESIPVELLNNKR